MQQRLVSAPIRRISLSPCESRVPITYRRLADSWENSPTSLGIFVSPCYCCYLWAPGSSFPCESRAKYPLQIDRYCTNERSALLRHWQVPDYAVNMAAAVLSGAASAAAHNVSLFFHSLFLLIVDTVRHALNLFPNSATRKDGLNSADRSTAHTSKQRALEEMGIASPPFTTASASASSSTAAAAAPTASTADATATASAMSSSRQPKKPTSRIVPALPRIPPVGRSDATVSGRSSQHDLDGLVSGMAAVHLDGSPKPDAGPGNQVVVAPVRATSTRAQSDSSVSSDSFAGGGKAVSSTVPGERDAGDPSRSDAGDLINEVGSTVSFSSPSPSFLLLLVSTCLSWPCSCRQNSTSHRRLRRS